MKVFSVSLVKDELDILPYTIEHLLSQDLDGILIADNMSDDGTREMIHQYARQNRSIHVYDDRDPRWFQAKKMSRLANLAHSKGADWILPCDADEWFTSINGRHTVGEILRTCPHPIVGAQIWHYFATSRDDASEQNPYRRMQWRNREPSRLHKVAFRWREGVRLEAGNHSLHEGNDRLMDYEYGIKMQHFPYRSAEQFLHGIENGYAALKATNLPRSYGGHWWQYGEHLEKTGPDGVKQWWWDNFYHREPEKTLVFDPIYQKVVA